MTLRVVYANIAPFVKVNVSTGEISGLMIEIWRKLTSWMNINYTLVRDPNDDYGKVFNGTFTGMIGSLYRNEVDVMLNPHPMKEYQVGMVSCSNAIAIGAYSFLSGKKAEDEGFFLYFTVLSREVWLLMGLSMMVITILSAMSSANLLPDTQKFYAVVYRYFWNLVVYLFKQGSKEKWILRTNVKKKSMTIPLVTTLWLFGVVFFIITTFQSLLVAKLSVKKFKPIVANMDDFAKKDIRGYGTKGLYLEKQLRNARTDIYKKTWEKIRNHLKTPKEILSEENIKKIQEGKLSILWGPEMISMKIMDYYKEKKTYCTMHLTLDYIFNFPLQVCARKISPEFTEKFNIGITRLVDSGLPKRYLRNTQDLIDFCSEDSGGDDIKPMDFDSIQGVLILWTAGISFSTIVLTCEIVSGRGKNEKRCKQKKGALVVKQFTQDKSHVYDQGPQKAEEKTLVNVRGCPDYAITANTDN
ncbi:hypothetical protein JTE90_005725 [Oedothorax gibbosus]|uniref:Ionotropic glutamate receptor L-glutamate and glycine-binding domain-containing protein n=1 Tax=Oedothorax gibbosus TaxID=931172 RepID=A0AAV6ULS1_9ARAC|nr:hypothetical protein JTE90_005725 [Oedothorax gibbosus]